MTDKEALKVIEEALRYCKKTYPLSYTHPHTLAFTRCKELLQQKINEEPTELPFIQPKYKFGETVFVPVPDDEYHSICCPKCKGTGHIQIELDEYGPVTINCPDCRGIKARYNQRMQYDIYTPMETKIEYIETTQECDGVCVEYGVVDSEECYDEERVFKDRSECETFCKELTEHSKTVAENFVFKRSQ